MGTFSEKALLIAGKLVPRYGNWGGPGNDVYDTPPPVDELDSAFREHDLGYEAQQFSLADRVLATRIDRLQKKGSIHGVRASLYAQMAKKYFALGGGEATEQEIMQLDRMIKPVAQKDTPVLKDGSNATQSQVSESQHSEVRSNDLANRRTQEMAPIGRKSGPRPSRPAPGNTGKRSHVFNKGARGHQTNRRGRGRFGSNLARTGTHRQVAPPTQMILKSQSGSGIKGMKKGFLPFIVNERVLDYKATSTTLTSGDALMNIKFNPASFLNCPRMHAQAKLYARYRVVRLWAEVTPCQNNTAIGNWEAYWDPDPNDNPLNTPAPNRIFIATNHKNSKGGIWWGNKTTRVVAPNKPDNFYVDPNEDEVLFNTSHRLVIIAGDSAQIVSGSTLFSLAIKGEILFWDETVEPSFAQSGVNDIKITNGGGGYTAAIPLGPTPTKSAGSMSFSVVNDNSTIVPPGSIDYYVGSNGLVSVGSTSTIQRYLALVQVTGTVLTGGSFTSSGSHTTVGAGTAIVNVAQTSLLLYCTIQVSTAPGSIALNNFYVACTATTVTACLMYIMPASIDVTLVKAPKSAIGKMIQDQVRRQVAMQMERPQVPPMLEILEEEKYVLPVVHDQKVGCVHAPYRTVKLTG